MKPFLYSLLVGTALVAAIWSDGNSLCLPDFVAIGFTAGLAGWFAAIYCRTPRRLYSDRPVHLPVAVDVRKGADTLPGRIAA